MGAASRVANNVLRACAFLFLIIAFSMALDGFVLPSLAHAEETTSSPGPPENTHVLDTEAELIAELPSATIEEIDSDGELACTTDEASIATSEIVLESPAPPSQVEQGDLPDSDELFAGYVEKTFYGEQGISTCGDFGESKFSGNALAIYNSLKSQIKAVADGERSSTVFSISDCADWSSVQLTEAEFGRSFVTSDGYLDSEASRELERRAVGEYSLADIVQCLLADCPYELYWFDKTCGWSAGDICSYSYSNSNLTVLRWRGEVSIKMYVATAYSANGGRRELVTDTAKTSAASLAAANASAIITANEGKTDYQKLLAYKDKICELTDYNKAAAENSNTPYGDPWQLIYVFDGNSSTQVVCEGYAKAFQLLCDKSTFSNATLKSHIISGYMDGGGHMWNNVVIDGASYLVDVTNCDSGTVGYPNALFMVGISGNNDDGYVFRRTIGSTEYVITYTYKSETKALYSDSGVLELADHNYAGFSFGQIATPAPVTYGYSNAPTLVVTPVLEGNSTGTRLAYQWYLSSNGAPATAVSGATSSSYSMGLGLAAGAHEAYCRITLYSSSGSVLCVRETDAVLLQVAKKAITASGVTGITTSKTYDGFTSVSGTPVISLSGTVSGDEVSATFESAAYDSSEVRLATKITIGGIRLIGATAGNYQLASDTLDIPGSIVAKSIASATATVATGPFTYSGSAVRPAVSVRLGEKDLSASTDYDLAYSDNVNAGIAAITITGKNNYTGTLSADFEISRAPISSASMGLSQDSFVYDGTAKRPTVTVRANASDLIEGRDYSVAYSGASVSAGQYTVTISGSGNYEGTQSRGYVISRAPISSASMGLSQDSFVYDGTAKRPSVTLLFNGEALDLEADYTVAYSTGSSSSGYAVVANPVSSGTYMLTVTGMGNFTGQKTEAFSITARSLDDGVTISIPKTSYSYSGQPVRPVPALSFAGRTLSSGTDYLVSYPDSSVDLGAYQLTVTGVGDFSGTRTLSYSVEAAPLSDATIDLSSTSFAYDGSEKRPSVTVSIGGKTLFEGVDYTVSYPGKPSAIGSYAVTITGTGNYSGARVVGYSIDSIPISASSVSLSNTTYAYDGTEKHPELTVRAGEETLVCGVDYVVSYPKACIDAGVYAVTLTGIGRCTGTKTVSFAINPRPFGGNVSVKVSDSTYAYSGSSVMPAPTVRYDDIVLANGTDYDVAYPVNPVSAGEYAIIVTGKGNYSGTATVSFSISPASLSNASLRVGDVTYGGSASKPVPVVTLDGRSLVAGVDYDVSYSNNNAIGTATISLTGKGNCTGTIRGKFEIVLATASLTKLSATKKGFTAKWTKAKRGQVAGYQIRYSTKSSMKSAKILTVNGYSKSSCKVTKLKAKKKFYVQVRTFVKIGGKTYSSAWSVRKNVKTK